MNVEALNTEILLSAYVQGFFPMAHSEKELVWYNPDPRAIIPLENYSPSKSMRSILRKNNFQIRLNTSFREVMKQCSKPRDKDDGQWINTTMVEEYSKLNQLGFAHSVEVFEENVLTGGLYGVHIGGAFFGESMYHHKPNASKIAFHYLIEILRKNGFQLLDTQFINDNVKRFGAIEISKKSYLKLLEKAMERQQRFSLD